MYICRGCGNFMEENERVCSSCGTPRGEEPKSETPPETEPLHGTVPQRAESAPFGEVPPKPEAPAEAASAPQAPPVYGPYARPVPQAKTNGLAIAGLICSGLGLHTCGLTAVAGLILSLLALRQIRERGEKGKGVAVAGVVIGAVILVFFAVCLLSLSLFADAG